MRTTSAARTTTERIPRDEVLAREALERVVHDDEWFIREVEAGLAHLDAGQVLTHEAGTRSFGRCNQVQGARAS